jgi:hypothetical protein
MKSVPWVWMFCLLSLMPVAGCDRRPARPPQARTPENEPATQPAEEPRPTTQELVNGPYKVVPLPSMPLAVKAPASWKIDVSGPVVFVGGPTPYGTATIQLAQRESIKSEQLDILMTGVKKDQEQHPDTVKKAELRDVGKIKLLERLFVLKPITSPKIDVQGNALLDAAGNIVTTTTVPVRWTLTAFVPYEQAFSRYELNFIDLTAEQYAADKAFLEKIVNSLTYEGGEPPQAIPATSAPPAPAH